MSILIFFNIVVLFIYIYVIRRKEIQFQSKVCRNIFLIVKICFLYLMCSSSNVYSINPNKKSHDSKQGMYKLQSIPSLDLSILEKKSSMLLKELDQFLYKEHKISRLYHPNPFVLSGCSEEIFKKRVEAVKSQELEILKLKEEFNRKFLLGTISEAVQKQSGSQVVVQRLDITTLKEDYKKQRECIQKNYREKLHQIKLEARHQKTGGEFQLRIETGAGRRWKRSWIEENEKQKKEMKHKAKTVSQQFKELVQQNKEASLEALQAEHVFQCSLLEEIQKDVLEKESMSSENKDSLKEHFSNALFLLKQKQLRQSEELKSYRDNKGRRDIKAQRERNRRNCTLAAKRICLEPTTTSSSSSFTSVVFSEEELQKNKQLSLSQEHPKDNETSQDVKTALDKLGVSEKQSVKQKQSCSAVEEKKSPFYNIDFMSSTQFSDTQSDEEELEETNLSPEEATEISLYLSSSDEVESLSPASSIEMPPLEGEESELLTSSINRPTIGSELPQLVLEEQEQPLSQVVQAESSQVSQGQLFQQVEQIEEEQSLLEQSEQEVSIQVEEQPSSQGKANVSQQQQQQQTKDAEKKLPFKKRPLKIVTQLAENVSSPSGSSVLFPSIHEAQLSSLQNLQGVLQGELEQIKGSLTDLIVQTNKYIVRKEVQLEGSISSTTTSSKLKRFNRLSQQNIKDPLYNSRYLNNTYLFGAMDTYSSGLEHKIRSGQVGFIMEPVSTFHIGISTSCYKRQIHKQAKIAEVPFFSSAHSNISCHVFSGVMAYNPKAKGITGYIIGSCGWGSIKNTRNINHAQMMFSTKGISGITLYGTLARLGYNVPILKNVLFTPYVENILAQVGWNTYTETVGIFPCTINSYKEKLWENNFGLHLAWKVNISSFLHAWITTNHKRYTLTSLSSNISDIQHFLYHQVSTPDIKKYNISHEIGSSYAISIGEKVDIFLKSVLYFNTFNKINEHNIRLFLHYSY